MDRSFLSHKDVIAASRDFVCVRPASYMDEGEAKFMMDLIRTRSGNPDNTNFVILAPDGKKTLVRGSRSPRMTYGTVEKMVASMTEIAAQHPGKKSAKVADDSQSLKEDMTVATVEEPLPITWAQAPFTGVFRYRCPKGAGKQFLRKLERDQGDWKGGWAVADRSKLYWCVQRRTRLD